MAGIALDGLASSLNTSEIVKSLIAVEAGPRTLLLQKQTSTNSLIAALQSLNTKVASVAEVATKAAKVDSWSVTTPSSSSASVTASGGVGAQPGTVTFTTKAIAKSQVSLVDADTLGAASTFTIKVGDKLTEVTAASSDPRDIADAVNKSSGAGVSATTIRTNSVEPPTYMLQLTGKSTGTDAAFEVYTGTKADVQGGTAPKLSLSEVQKPENAEIVLFAGTANEKTLSSQTNTFEGLAAGVNVTVSAIEDKPVTVTIARDDAAIRNLVSGLVGVMGVALSEITSRSATTTTTNSDGATSVTGGLFSGESSTRALRDQLISAGSMPVGGGYSPSQFGVVLGRDGTFTFDESKFNEAMTADPAKVQAWATELAGRVGKVATNTSDSIDGTLTRQITGQQDMYKDLGVQIGGWDRRLEQRESTLLAKFTAMEVALSSLQSQQSWLTSQLASLSTS